MFFLVVVVSLALLSQQTKRDVFENTADPDETAPRSSGSTL